MSRFGKIIKGTADVRTVELALCGLDEPVKVGVRPLSAWDETNVLEQARAFAKARNIDKPTGDDPIYVMGVWVNTLLVGCISLEAEDKGDPFFGSVEEILKELDRDRISYLYEQQQRVQEDHGCRKERLSPDETLAAIHDLVTKEVGDPDLPFWKWGPTLRASFMRFMAVLLWNSQPDKSQFGLIFAAASENGTVSTSEP